MQINPFNPVKSLFFSLFSKLFYFGGYFMLHANFQIVYVFFSRSCFSFLFFFLYLLLVYLRTIFRTADSLQWNYLQPKQKLDTNKHALCQCFSIVLFQL